MGGGGTEGFAYTKEQVSQLAQYPFERASAPPPLRAAPGPRGGLTGGGGGGS